jgi:hypothetical protein
MERYNFWTVKVVRLALVLAISLGCFPPFMHKTFMVSELDSGWIATPADNICGVKEPRMVKQPGVVNWRQLMDSTPEMEKMKKEGIKRDSPKGAQLISEAESRCKRACVKQMRVASVDSMWKNITHVSKAPWDQTNAVITLMKNENKKEVLFRWKEKV